MRLLLLVVGLFAATRVWSADAIQPEFDASRIYGDIHVAAGTVAHSDLRFHPVFASFSAGAYVRPGIGVEGFFDTGLDSDEQAVFDLSVNQASGIALRLESPPQRGLQAYVLLGYVNFSLDQLEEDSRGTRTVTQTYSGARVSVGLLQRLQVFPNMLFGAEYRIYHSGDGILVDGWSLGLRVNVQ